MMVALLELSPEVFEAGGFCCFDLAAGSACAESCERGGGELAGGDCAVPRSDKSAIPTARIAGLSDIISILAKSGTVSTFAGCLSTRSTDNNLYTAAMPVAEVEIKFRASDLEALAEKLRETGFRLETPRTHEMNTLYDFPDNQLRRSGQLLRIRNYGGSWTVTHKAKGKTGRHKSRVETQTPVSDGEKLHAIFFALGLRPIFRYEKFRSEWSEGAGHVVVDETPIGNFAEIEGPPRWIDATAKKLGVGRRDYITQNYAALFFAWKERGGSRAEEMTFAAVSERGRGRPRHTTALPPSP